MSRSYLILTDSGDIQEEAPSLGKPVLVMRETTERPEAVEVGTGRLVETDQNKIISETNLLHSNKETYLAMSVAENPYGDGKAATRIAEKLVELQKTGLTMLCVETNLDVAFQIAKRVYVMEKGLIKFSGTKDELLGNIEIQQKYLGVHV